MMHSGRKGENGASDTDAASSAGDDGNEAVVERFTARQEVRETCTRAQRAQRRCLLRCRVTSAVPVCRNVAWTLVEATELAR